MQGHKRLLGNKKGQFYIFVAVIFCSLALSLVIGDSGRRGYREVFSDIKDNFLTEAPLVINSALYQDDDIEARFDKFISFFQDYSRSRNVRLTLLYFLSDGDDMLIKNGLLLPVTLGNSELDIELKSAAKIEIEKPSYLDVEIDNYRTRLYFENKSRDLKLYFRFGLLK